jgi:hypothetical protein
MMTPTCDRPIKRVAAHYALCREWPSVAVARHWAPV